MPDLPGTDDRVVGLHQRLEVRRGAERAERLRLALEEDVERGREDVHVLAVEHEDEEPGDDRDLRDDEHRLERHRVRADVGDRLGRERPPAVMLVRRVAGGDLGAPVEQQRGDYEEDHPEHEIGLVDVRPVKPRFAREARGRLPQPDDGEDAKRGQHRDREQVLDKAQGAAPPESGDGEVTLEERAVGLDDGQQQDDEAPERERVGPAGDWPLEQLALREDVGELCLYRILEAGQPLGRYGPADTTRVSQSARQPAAPSAATVTSSPATSRTVTISPQVFTRHTLDTDF